MHISVRCPPDPRGVRAGLELDGTLADYADDAALAKLAERGAVAVAEWRGDRDGRRHVRCPVSGPRAASLAAGPPVSPLYRKGCVLPVGVVGPVGEDGTAPVLVSFPGGPKGAFVKPGRRYVLA